MRRRFTAAEREFLQKDHTAGDPAQDYASGKAGVTYLAVDDLSESEADMEISDESGRDEPSKKRARVSNAEAATADHEAPKWSNPDPYTVLPPVDTGKKTKDVVQLIRKARVAATEAKQSANTEGLDFIACDSDEEDDIAIVKDTSRDPPKSAPIGPKAESVTKQGRNNPGGPQTSKGPNRRNSPPKELNPPRKRTHDDRIKLPLPHHSKLKKTNKMPVGGFIVATWRVIPGEEPCPWVEDHSATTEIAVR